MSFKSKHKSFAVPGILLCSLFLILFFDAPRASADPAYDQASSQSTNDVQNLKTSQEHPEDYEVQTAKLVTWDTVPNDPGHFEFDTSYYFSGSGKVWATDGSRHGRKLFRSHNFDELTFMGVVKDVDIFIGEGFAILANKENNVNEMEGVFDPVTGDEMEDSTEGPAHGHGLKDFLTGARWRFYNDESNQLSFAYVPLIQIPIGRRSKFEHLGPSQGFTSFDNRLVMTKNIGRINVDANLAYNTPLAHLKKTGNYCGTLNTSFAAGYQWTRWFHPEVEAIYNHAFEKRGKGGKIFTLVCGVIIPVTPFVRLDVGIFQDVLGSGVDQNTSGYFRLVLFT